MTPAETYFNELTTEIPDVKPGKMFGAACMKTANGKSGAMFWQDHLVVKLQGDPLHEAKNLAGSKPFEPMAGRPMKEWIQIPFDHRDHWKKFATISVQAVNAMKK